MKTHSKKQKIYRMKGCSSKTRKSRKGGRYLGNSFSKNLENISANNLAYPAKNISFYPNPFLAYTGKGGNNLSCMGDVNQSGFNDKDVLAYTGNNSPISNAYPSPGPPVRSNNWINSNQQGGRFQQGGSFQQGGNCNCGVNYSVQSGGSQIKHRSNCKCSTCKKGILKGGNWLPFGKGLPEMKGVPYPDGLVGSPWRPQVADWPGVDGIPGDRNHLAYNTYSPVDISRQMVETGANPPFSIGGKKKRKAGAASNMLSQDLINLGRQLQFNVGSTYNALNGYAAPVSPLPWKDQFPNSFQK